MGRAGTKFFMRKGEPNTKVLPCLPTCHSLFQDQLYGAGNRLANRRSPGAASAHTLVYRCSICGHERQHGSLKAAKAT